MNAENLKTRRKELGITQEDLAKRLGVSRKTINSYENGGLIPESKKILIEKVVEIKPSIKNEVSPVDTSDYVMVEYVDLAVSAGVLGGGDVKALPDKQTRLVPREYERGNYLVVRVDGESMNDGTLKSLCNGDEVLIKEMDMSHDLPIRNRLFVITSREGNVLKQITEVNHEEKYITCHSFNSAYTDFNLRFDEICQIFVVCKIVQKQIRLT